MKVLFNNFSLLALLITTSAYAGICDKYFDKNYVSDFTSKSTIIKYQSNLGIESKEFESFSKAGLNKIPEFVFIKELAEKMNLRVWLFGGTASSYVHYAKWDYLRLKGKMNLQEDRFDYDYTNIFRSTQDLDIVVDATQEVAKAFQDELVNMYPNFLGAKTKWEVRTLHHQMGDRGTSSYKEALLNDVDFSNQNTDSNSLAMIEITTAKDEPAI